MFSKTRSWLGDLANIVTLVQVFVAGGIATLLATGAQGLLGVVLGISPVERAILGVGVFLVALGAILAGFKALLERRSQSKTMG